MADKPNITLLDKVRLLEAVGTGSRHDPLELKVLLHVIMCMDNNTGLSRIGTTRLAERTGVSKRTVLRTLERLEGSGVLPVYLRGGSARDGTRTANIYRPNLGYSVAKAAAATADTVHGALLDTATGDTHGTGDTHDTGDTGDADRCHSRRGPVSQMAPYPSYPPGGLPEGDVEGAPPHAAAASAGAPAARGGREHGALASEPEGFSGFWAACLKQEHRAETLVEFRRIVGEGIASPGELTAGMRIYADAKGHLPPERIKFPDNWLKEERWKENPKPPKPKQQTQPDEGSKVSRKADKPKRQQAAKGTRKETRKTAPASSGGGLAPQPTAAPAQRRQGSLGAGSRVQHTHSGLIGTVTAADLPGSALDVQWDGLEGVERLLRHSLRSSDLTGDASGANQRIREGAQRRAEGRRLKLRREYLRQSTEDVGGMIGWPAGTIAAVEAGLYEGADLPAVIDALNGAFDAF